MRCMCCFTEDCRIISVVGLCDSFAGERFPPFFRRIAGSTIQVCDCSASRSILFVAEASSRSESTRCVKREPLLCIITMNDSDTAGSATPESSHPVAAATPTFRYVVRVETRLIVGAYSHGWFACRSAAMGSTSPQVARSRVDSPTKSAVAAPAEDDIIDSSVYFNAAPDAAPADAPANHSWWRPATPLRPVPAFYPLEKSARFVEDDSVENIARRLAECWRLLSVQAVVADARDAAVTLRTAEHVEMHLTLWSAPPPNPFGIGFGGAADHHPPGVVVELQRRRGDSMAFHRYSRYILDAAVGLWEPGVQPYPGDGPGSAMLQPGTAASSDTLGQDMIYSKNVQRLLSAELLRHRSNRSLEADEVLSEQENAVVAMEIAHGLLMKDRMDARQLGLESLCLLTDPRKTGFLTALLTSHVVLLGTTSGVQILPPGDELAADLGLEDTANNNNLLMMDEGPFQEIHECILRLVQFSRIGDDDDEDEDNPEPMGRPPALTNAGALLHPQLPNDEHLTLLHNLALAVLANALDVIQYPERWDQEPETLATTTVLGEQHRGRSQTHTGIAAVDYWGGEEPDASASYRPRVRTASSSEVTNEFLQQQQQDPPDGDGSSRSPRPSGNNISRREILGTLISELGNAAAQPHNATLSAKCLGSLLRASDDAKKRAKELGAKTVVATALDVGVLTHRKLETECQRVVRELSSTTTTRTIQRAATGSLRSLGTTTATETILENEEEEVEQLPDIRENSSGESSN
jgi:hypothetical protein